MENNQEILIENRAFKLKIFDYFYYILSNKNVTSLFTLYFLHLLEIIQIISYAFSEPHLATWKLSLKSSQNISLITSVFRLYPLLQFVPIGIFILIFILFIIIIIFIFLFLFIQIILLKENHKINNKLIVSAKIFIPPLTIFLYIPILELFLSPFKCVNNNVFITGDKIKCWSQIHYLFMAFGIITILIFLVVIFSVTIFNYYPFQAKISNIKINSYIDTIILVIKLLYELKSFFIKNEYISIFILLILSFFLLIEELDEPIYNRRNIEIILSLRNILVFWTFFMLFVAKICFNTKVNNLIYLLIFGYPIIIFSFIMFYKNQETKFSFENSSFNNINSCLTKTRFLLRIVSNYIENHKNSTDYNDNSFQKNDIILKGFVQIHCESCLREDCPLTKFENNRGNINMQKQSLLNYISSYFNNAIKKFPNNKLLRLYQIQFNYDQKYNLINLKANLEEVKKMKSDLKEQFIIHCMEQEIIKIKIKDDDENESEKELIILEQNYKKLKNIIINTTKLFAEFWGIFATNITNNLNTTKLYKLGDKLNLYLKEINYLWDNNLKNKKINPENENIVQLYSLFLREILWNKIKSEEIQNKINDEHKNLELKNAQENNNNNQPNNYEKLLESQDHIILVNTNDKGKCFIFQISNNLTYLFGYQRHELINKPFEILLPPIFADGYSKKIEAFLKDSLNKNNMENELLNVNEKNINFVLIRNKMGYIVPFDAKYLFYDENDFSNNLIIKIQIESRDSKSIYPYYILTRSDFSIESISSSAIHLDLSMDLLKKYVIKLNLLIRTSKDNYLNIFDKFKNYEEEPKNILWVYPNLIYPKNDIIKNKDIQIQDLIQKSKKKKMKMQIFEMKYNINEILGFAFKFTEINKKKNKNNEINIHKYVPSNKNEINFDLMNLKYIRTIIVKKKSGLRNLRTKNDEDEIINNLSNKQILQKNKKNKNEDKFEESSNNVKIEAIITNDTLLELQSKDSNEIKAFINLLPFYGNEISLIKHRPNREKYPVGKAQEPLIKIDLSNTIKRIDLKLRENPELYKKFKNYQTENKNSSIKNNNNSIINIFNSSNYKNDEINNKENDEINRDFGNNSIYLKNLFNVKNLKTIKYVDYLIYGFINIIMIVEFILTYISLDSHKKRFEYLSDSYKFLTDIVYIKYYITEGILPNIIPHYLLLNYNITEDYYYSSLKQSLEEYRQEFSTKFPKFSNPSITLPQEYKDFTSKRNISIFTLSNKNQKIEQEPFFSAVNRMTTAIFYITSSTNNKNITMDNKYSYELMLNLINGYYISFETITYIIFDDFKKTIKESSLNNIIIFIVSIFISFLYLTIYWKMMAKLDIDREKPINLFLTIKKQIFENLKNSSENFSNKLLNKFFGNEENEEESQQQYRSNVTSSDINIAKFKALNEYKASINKKNSFLFYFIQLVIFYIICNIFLLAKYLNYIHYNNNIINFTKVYNSTQFAHIFLLGRVNIVRHFFFNESFTTLENIYGENINNFIYCFLDMSGEFDNALKETSKTDSFLKDDYKNLFIRYVYENFTELILKDIEQNYEDYKAFLETIVDIEIGFKYISMQIYESLRILMIKYIDNSQRNQALKNVSELLNDPNWIVVDLMIIYLAKPWYKNIIELMEIKYYSYIDKLKSTNITVFAIVISLITLNFWIIWKRFEDRYIDLIRKSFELINLIPEEIKNIIVHKLNEQN